MFIAVPVCSSNAKACSITLSGPTVASAPLSKYIFPEARMRFSPAQEQRRRLLQNYASIFSLRAQPIMEIDWRETGWFLEREEDDLAGYLFTEDCEVRKGLD
jgi:hypothetical protein